MDRKRSCIANVGHVVEKLKRVDKAATDVTPPFSSNPTSPPKPPLR